MDRLIKLIVDSMDRHKASKHAVKGLSVVMVFIVTYMLILPAFTLNKDDAARQGGIDVPGIAATSEDVSDSESAEANTDETSGDAVVPAGGNEETAETQDSDTADSKTDADSGKTGDSDRNTDKTSSDKEQASDAASDSEQKSEAADKSDASDPLTYEGRNYRIAVADKDAILPDNTEIQVDEIDQNKDASAYDEYFKQALEAVQAEAEKDGDKVADLDFARFYDISLVADGREINPSGNNTVNVTIEYDAELRAALNVENKDNIRVIHFTENKATGKTEAEVLDNKEAKVEVETADNLLKEATFDAESFSVYGLVCLKEADEQAEAAESADDKDADADKADADDADKTEDNANSNSEIDLGTAVVSTVDGSDLPEDVDGHADVVAGKKAIKSVEKNIDDLDTDNTRYEVFDIALDNIDESEYKDGFKVEVSLPENIKGRDFRLFHIHDGQVEELDLNTNAAVSADGNKEVTGFTFETDGFSQFVLSYTVDFEYEVDGKVFKYSMEGGNSIKLSELFDVLRIGVDIKEVSDVTFSDESLLTVRKSGFLGMGNDWILESQKPFNTEENLTITMKDGSKFVVKVTDASETSDMSTLLTDVSITGAKQEGGAYVMYPGQPYGISLSFKEVNKNNGQFPMNSSFTYQLPAGLMPTGSTSSGVIPITLSGGVHSGETVNLNYTINGSGLITFTWDTTTNPEGFDQLKDNLYSQFKVNLECTYNGETGSLKFSDTITKDVKVKNNGEVTVNKKGKYNPTTNCVDYEVSVYSDGITKDVVITDTVTGNALTYKNDATSSSSIYGKEVPNPISTGSGFTVTIPEMADQETVTVKYSAAVDLDKVTKNPDGSWGTYDETGNKVIVKSKDNPDVEKENSGKDYENKISMSNIGKNASNIGETNENGHATVTWKIHANDNANVSMGGHTISDSIDGNSVPMTYNGDGIYVTAYNQDGSVNYSNKFIPWSQMTKNDTSWSWKVPNSYPDNQKLSYEITYTTDVDVSDRIVETNVTNHTESDNGGSADGGGKVTPYGGAVTAHKKVVKTDRTANTVTWEVNFDVPATGLDSAQIVDTMPTYYNTAGELVAVDNYMEGTITVTPELEGDESYEVSTSEENGKQFLTVDFYKLVNEQKVTGLTGTGSKRRIRVQFQTEIDSDWVAATVDNPNDNNAFTHTNNAVVKLNGQDINTSASTRIDNTEPGMNKIHGAQDSYSINGNKLPAYPFVLTLQGVSEDSFDDNGNLKVIDTFNSKYLAFYAQSEDGKGDNQHVGRVFGSDQYKDMQKGESPIWNATKITTNSVISNAGEGKIEINLNREDIVKEDGSFYNYYYVYYYLTVKDPIALEKLQAAIQTSDNGVYKLLNKASNEKFGTVTDEFEYSIPVIDKSIVKPDGKPGKVDDYAYYENGNYMVDYKIDVNPNALQLGDEDELTLTDDYTNLAVDYTTIKIQKYVDDALVDAPANEVSWNRKGNRVTYTLQNGIHYVVSYSARITGEPDNQNKVTYSNTAEFFGVKDWETHSSNIKSGGEGTSPTYGITVFKHAKGAGSTPLEGATFKLYKYTATQEKEDGWKNRPTATTDLNQDGWEAVINQTTNQEVILVTNADGVAKTQSSDGIQPWTWYKLVETEAPIYKNNEKYQTKTFAYVFWITDKGAADYANYVYLNDDVVAIDNEPPIPDKVDIGVEKAWTGDTDISKRKDITVRLYADGVPYDSWKDSDGNGLEPREDTVKVLKVDADGNTESYTWKDLPGGPVYSVVEDSVPGYTTTYSPKNTQVSDTINIKNKYIPGKTSIHVKKNWSGITDYPEDITVQLKRKVSANAEIRVVNHNNTLIEHFSVPVGSVVDIQFAGTVPTEYEER